MQLKEKNSNLIISICGTHTVSYEQQPSIDKSDSGFSLTIEGRMWDLPNLEKVSIIL